MMHLNIMIACVAIFVGMNFVNILHIKNESGDTRKILNELILKEIQCQKDMQIITNNKLDYLESHNILNCDEQIEELNYNLEMQSDMIVYLITIIKRLEEKDAKNT